MRSLNRIGSATVIMLLTVTSAFGQERVSLAQNAALRYWAAFSQLRDSGITDQDAKELDSILEKMGPSDESKFKDLVEKNTLALEIMTRGTLLPKCDWGLDYGLGGDLPVDYARKALTLGRLNVLYAMHLYHAGNKDGAIRALAAGLRFSHDVSSGGSLFATLVAKDLLVTHLMAINAGLRMGQLSVSPQLQLKNAVTELGNGLDWSGAAKRDIEALRAQYAKDQQAAAALNRIVDLYSAFLRDESKQPMLTEAINSAPQELATVIPNPKRVLEQKQELAAKLSETRGLFR